MPSSISLTDAWIKITQMCFNEKSLYHSFISYRWIWKVLHEFHVSEKHWRQHAMTIRIWKTLRVKWWVFGRRCEFVTICAYMQIWRRRFFLVHLMTLFSSNAIVSPSFRGGTKTWWDARATRLYKATGCAASFLCQEARRRLLFAILRIRMIARVANLTSGACKFFILRYKIDQNKLKLRHAFFLLSTTILVRINFNQVG